MSLIQKEPIRDFLTLRDSMDRMFNDLFQWNFTPESGQPVMDMYQTEDKIVVKAALPGVKSDDIHISVTGDMLTIRGEIKQDEVVKNASYHLRERSFGTFSRTLPLPTSVITDKARAEFENGILILELPKAEEVRPKSITIKTK